MRLFLTCLLLLGVSSVFGQNLKAFLDKGDRFFGRGDFKSALQNYESAEKLAPGDARVKYRIGHVYLSQGNDVKALPYFEESYRLQPNVDPDIDYFLGTALQMNFRFYTAMEHFKKYRLKNKKMADMVDFKIQECKLGDSLINNPGYCKIKVLEWPINSIYRDYGPALPSNENELIFTSARDTLKFDKKYGVVFEDVLISHKQGSAWSVPEQISPKINETSHDAVTYLTPDGKTIFLYYEKGNGDLYSSTMEGGEWTEPGSMGAEINSLAAETSGCLSPDGKKFYFTSDRSGGLGGLDIYVAEKLNNGWGNVRNLGPTINTPGNEDAPFIHPDGTMYFSSDGQPGLGDYDIFKSELRDDKWTKPVNMGYPINTPKLENHFFLSVDKKRAYFSSVRHEGVGNSDICEATFFDPPPPPKKEEPVVAKEEPKKETPAKDEFADGMVSLQKDLGLASKLVGKVIDADNAKPLRAQITLVDNKTNTVKERVYSNDSTGEFSIVIPHGGNYGINTSVDGYLFNSLNFEVPLYSEEQVIETAILMSRVTVGSKAVMKNIFFDVGKAEIKNESIGELERILDLLTNNPGVKLQINGHTDNSGNAATNKTLSLKRAETVMHFLITRGIDHKRLKAVGFGQERPIVSNDDETGGREINRRTEIEVIETEAAKN